MHRRVFLVATATAPLALGASRAEAWPTKPVRFIVPFPPGGGTDTISRIVADQLGRALGQTFVIDNKGGAGGTLGIIELARAPADGYTIGMITSGSHGTQPTLYARPPY